MANNQVFTAQTGTQNYEYTNETFSGCDMVASISIKNGDKSYNKIIGELQTVSYSIHMEKKPIRSIGNVNAKDYVMGPRTIAGSLVFSVFNKHFSQDLVNNINSANSVGTVYLVDEIPPFDIIISAANEYGYRSRLVIYGIRLLNEGQVMSVNDVYTENTYQFFATDLEYLTDEMTYTRSSTEKKYQLNDIVPYTYENPPVYEHNAILYYQSDAEKEYWDKVAKAGVKLSTTVKQPTRSNNKGNVDFFLDPGQAEGTIYVTDSDDDVTQIKIKANTSVNSNNKQTYASKVFYPGTYIAYFSGTDGAESNKVKFTIKKYTSSGNTQLITPTISKLTSKSVTIQSSSSKHDKVMLSSLYGDELNIYNMNNKKCKISGLDSNTSYSVRTYSNSDNDSSKTIQFKTLAEYKAYDDLKNYLKANKTVLGISSLSDYNDIIEDSKDQDLTPGDAVSKLKSKYQNELSTLSLSSSTYKEDKARLEAAISICSSIISIALKTNNDLISAVNKNNNVPAPTTYLDENYDNIFVFDGNIVSAEFFRVYGEVEQYATTVNSYNFKTINDKTNSFRFLGKQGVTHYVQAIINNVRSSKVEFYVMTAAEKQDYINKQFAKDKLSTSDISKLNATVNNDLNDNISTLDEQRAFMINAKKISNDKVMAPSVLSIEADVTIETFLSNLINDSDKFFLAIATYEDVVNNDDIYKIPFSCKDEIVTISQLYNGIKENTAYAIWIENSNCEQISNATTFSYIPGIEISDDITSYAVKDLIATINSIAKNELPVDIYESIQGTIEHNEGITSNEIISSAIEIVTTNVVSKNNMLNFLYSIKKYIGIFVDPTETFLTNINYNTSSISFDSTMTGTILVYDLDQMKNITLAVTNTINVNDYVGNTIIIVAIESSLNSKSNVLVINKSEKYMEVL